MRWRFVPTGVMHRIDNFRQDAQQVGKVGNSREGELPNYVSGVFPVIAIADLRTRASPLSRLARAKPSSNEQSFRASFSIRIAAKRPPIGPLAFFTQRFMDNEVS